MTTSPTRISQVINVLRTLDLSLVTEIFLVLPQQFSRGGEYLIPAELLNYPKLRILRTPTDLGPITKLLPAVREIRQRRDASSLDPLLITIDDDIGYGFSMVRERRYHYFESDEPTVFAASTQPLAMWNLDESKWPQGESEGQRIVSEGFAAVAYPVNSLDVDTMESLSQISTACKFSDDLVISYVLSSNGIPKKTVNSIYYNINRIVEFSYGMREDALHRGAGLNGGTVNHANHDKYNRCLTDIALFYQQ
jgi:hypothetical protein